MNIFRTDINQEKYFIVEYFIQATKNFTLKDAAWALAIGQSVGNPNIRNQWETDELFEQHSCIILDKEKKLTKRKQGKINIAFPTKNINLKEDGVSQLLCQIMGGQLDINCIKKCHVVNITFPESFENEFLGPKFGINGIRTFTNNFDKPLLGAIIKPKIGITPNILLEMVKELVEGGANFIKEDEIMSNPACCPIEERVPLIMDYLKNKPVIYSVCINSNPPYLLQRVKKVHELGGNSIHVNFWSGLGTYQAIREMNLPLFLHFQKSGDKIITNNLHNFHIKWKVICKLAGLMGVDFIHAGMWGGYLEDNEKELKEVIQILHAKNVMPALSCGMHPGLVQAITSKFGNDYLANVGGAIHGHPGGSKKGTQAMRQAIDKTYGPEYQIAIKKWGKQNE